jgi:predicted outer membrane protein
MQTHREIDMLRDKILKGLLGVSAVAALFASLASQAQSSQATSGATRPSGTQSSTSGAQGTPDSTSGQSGTSGTAGSIGSSGASGTAGQTGSSSAADQTGGGSMGSTGSPSSRSGAGQTSQPGQPGAAGSAAGQSGTSGTSGSTASGSTSTSTAAAAAGSLSKADQKIVMDMARANMAEIEAGKLAQSKSQNDQVKNFAQQMIDDHTKALNDVQALAQSKGVTLPTEPDAKHKAMAAKLGNMSGDAFDRAYMSQAGVSDHKTVHAMLARDQSRAKDPDVKALAAKMLPTVEQHLNSAQQMPTAKGGKTSAGGDAAADKVTTGSKRNQ